MQVWSAVVDAFGAPWPVDPRTAPRRWSSACRSWRASCSRRGAEFYLLGADGFPVDRANYYSDLDGTVNKIIYRFGEVRHGDILSSIFHKIPLKII